MAIRSNERSRKICQNVTLIRKSVCHQKLLTEETDLGKDHEDFQLQVILVPSSICSLAVSVQQSLQIHGQAKFRGKKPMNSLSMQVKELTSPPKYSAHQVRVQIDWEGVENWINFFCGCRGDLFSKYC